MTTNKTGMTVFHEFCREQEYAIPTALAAEYLGVTRDWLVKLRQADDSLIQWVKVGRNHYYGFRSIKLLKKYRESGILDSSLL